jgi:signal transduction histidine kinase
MKYFQAKPIEWLKRLFWGYAAVAVLSLLITFIPDLQNFNQYLLPTYAISVLTGLLVLRRYIAKIEQKLELVQQDRDSSVQRSHLERIAGLSDIAGGIAHEINNPLAIIMGKSETLRMKAEAGPVAPEVIDAVVGKIELSIRRITRIVNSLRSITRDNSNENDQWISVESFFDDLNLFWGQRLKNSGIAMRIQKVDPKMKIYGKHSQLLTVFSNLISNSYKAVKDSPNPRWVGLEFSGNSSSFEFAVTDSGSGIPKEIRKRIFDAFFTTGPVNEGTGLGLTVSYAIIVAHGGKLHLDDSSINTRFIITIPKYEEKFQAA